MTNWQWVAIIAGVITFGVVLWVTLDAFVFKQVINKDSSNKMAISSTKISGTASRATENKDLNILTECTTGTDITDAQAQEMVSASIATDVSTARTYRYCDILQYQEFINFVGDSKGEWEYKNELQDTTLGRPKAIIFEPRGANDIIASINNISGGFYSVHLVTGTHGWQDGFNPGDGSTTVDTAFTEILKSAQQAGTLLVGEKAVHDTTDHDEPPFEFSAKDAVEFPMQPVPTTTDVTALNADVNRKKGAIHIALDTIAYAFTLDGKERQVRVLIGKKGNTPLMGVKQVLKDGKWLYLNKTTDQLVEDEPAVPYSFWNQGNVDQQLAEFQTQVESASGEEKTQLEADIVRLQTEIAAMDAEKTALTTMFDEKRYATPIEVVGDIDWENFKTKNVSLDLISSGFVGFRNAKINQEAGGGQEAHTAMTEAELAENYVQILKLFDINSLTLKAQFTFTDPA